MFQRNENKYISLVLEAKQQEEIQLSKVLKTQKIHIGLYNKL